MDSGGWSLFKNCTKGHIALPSTYSRILNREITMLSSKGRLENALKLVMFHFVQTTLNSWGRLKKKKCCPIPAKFHLFVAHESPPQKKTQDVAQFHQIYLFVAQESPPHSLSCSLDNHRLILPVGHRTSLIRSGSSPSLLLFFSSFSIFSPLNNSFFSFFASSFNFTY